MKLIICDTERKVMRVYKGTWLLMETQLLDTPVALAVIYSEATVPRIASIAVCNYIKLFQHPRCAPYVVYVRF